MFQDQPRHPQEVHGKLPKQWDLGGVQWLRRLWLCQAQLWVQCHRCLQRKGRELLSHLSLAAKLALVLFGFLYLCTLRWWYWPCIGSLFFWCSPTCLCRIHVCVWGVSGMWQNQGRPDWAASYFSSAIRMYQESIDPHVFGHFMHFKIIALAGFQLFAVAFRWK